MTISHNAKFIAPKINFTQINVEDEEQAHSEEALNAPSINAARLRITNPNATGTTP